MKQKYDKGFETGCERGLKLSGGQKQRIGIARALYKANKRLLILDEATSALDNKTEEELINNIYSLKNNYTLIMIAHRLSTLKNCKRIFKIENGTLNEVSVKISSKIDLRFKYKTFKF